MAHDHEDEEEEDKRLESLPSPFYRFDDGTFIKADSFEDAKRKKIERLEAETEDKAEWHKCTCLGLEHQWGCVAKPRYIPF